MRNTRSRVAVALLAIACVTCFFAAPAMSAELYSPLLKNAGTTVCTAINIGGHPFRISVQIIGHNDFFEGPIIGDEITQPGGWWYAVVDNTTAEFTRGVIRVSGGHPRGFVPTVDVP